MMKKILFFIVIVSQIAVPAVKAQPRSTLNQTVQPIICTYTTTATGSLETINTQCADKVAPTLETVVVRDGYPLVTGRVLSTNFATFRVWIGGKWFTYGVSNSLKIESNTWTLDLNSLSSPLPVGEYTLVIEQLTKEGFLLQARYQDALSVPLIKIAKTTTTVNETTTTKNTVVINGGQESPYNYPKVLETNSLRKSSEMTSDDALTGSGTPLVRDGTTLRDIEEKPEFVANGIGWIIGLSATALLSGILYILREPLTGWYRQRKH